MFDRSLAPIAVISDRAGLGDGLMVCPLIWAVAKRYPGHPIWWLAACSIRLVGQVSALMPERVERIVELPRARYQPLEIIAALRKLPRFHRVFDVRSRFGDIALARLVLKSGGFRISTSLTSLKRPKAIVDRSWSTIERDAGQKLDWQQAAADGFALPPEIVQAAAIALPPGPNYVAIVLTRRPHKAWPMPLNLELGRALLEDGLTPVFFSGPDERADIDLIRAQLPEAKIAPARLPGDAESVFRLDLAAASARRMSVGVSPDTGLGHLLGVSLVPVVSLFGPGNPARWAPMATRNIVIAAPEVNGARRMETIDVPRVLAAVQSLL
jgi:ADP-heptose:LPS heptosyltransferase